MDLDQRLVDAAVDQLRARWREAGRQGAAAAVCLDDGEILTSVGLDNLNAAASLCAETGALCQAYTRDRRVTASACVGIDRVGVIGVLAPCGICQERLALWGPDVLVAVPDDSADRGWRARTMREVNPFYWGARFAEGDAWPGADAHC